MHLIEQADSLANYIDDNYEELYSYKVGYTVEKIDDKFKVVLMDASIISFEDIFK